MKNEKKKYNITNMKLKSNLKIISYQNKINEIKDHIYKLKKASYNIIWIHIYFYK